MKTDSNTYTVIYTAVVVILVAAILAFVSQKLGPAQAANEKAETISQILTAARFGDKESWQKKGNAATIEFYKENIGSAVLVNVKGTRADILDCSNAEIYSVSDLKAENYRLRNGEDFLIPVYIFRNGVAVLPVYGAGLWGPVWGYIALQPDFKTIAGAYFDHESETPGLGGKIKDDPSFREAFSGKTVDFNAEKPFEIIKGGIPAGQTNAVDAITGATMTSKGLDKAIAQWLTAYRAFSVKMRYMANTYENGGN